MLMTTSSSSLASSPWSSESRPPLASRKAVPLPIAVYARQPTCYPTPPASPDLDNPAACLPAIGDIGFAISTGLFTPPPDIIEIDQVPSPPTFASSVTVVPLDEFEFDHDFEVDEAESDQSEEIQPESDLSAPAQDHEVAQVSPDSARLPLERQGSRSFGPIPIPILLDTSHDLPHASTFRLASPNSLLSSLGGNRVLLLGASQTVWDRMPYSAASAAAVLGRADEDEESVETMIGGEREDDAKISGLQWGLRSKKSRERISSIFVHPPTPERYINNGNPTAGPSRPADTTPTGLNPTPSPPVPTLPDEPVASSSNRNLPKPIQVLPEVRSPPRRSIALAADSLPLARGRNRRPKLFGFTEISDSSSSANSSRHTSPDRTSVIDTPEEITPIATRIAPIPPPRLATASLAPQRDSLPKALARTQSETSLPTMSVIASNTPALQPPRGRRVSGLKLDFAGIIPVVTHEDSRAAVVSSPYSSRLIRKKSGEILKSALKYIGPLGPNGTPLKQAEEPDEVEDTPRARFESKSLPATPSCPKYVHFDTQLERVKLFLQDQKPQVVSRDGSPTAEYTTSEGEEYPFPSTDEEDGPIRKVLQIKLPNFPTSHPPDAELYLESLFLEEDRKSLKGMILCKNLSFQKWVAARFTLDFWQTTSEVTAQHKETVRGGAYDRFTFVIKLHDVLARLSEKTLFVALRYHSAGKEIWDSNGGQNYQVLFEKVVPPTVTLGPKRANSLIQPGMGKAVGGRTSQWSVTGGGRGDDRLADLRAKLSHLTGGDPDNSPPQASPSRVAGPLSPRYGMMSFASAISPSNSPRRSNSDQDLPELPSAGPAFSARYDFGAALKTTRDHRKAASPNGKAAHGDVPDVKTGLLSFPTSTKANNGHAATEFYSPRFSPNKLPESLPPTHDLLFSPPTSASTDFSTPTDSPLGKKDSGLKIANIPTPTFAVQEPSPPVLADEESTLLLSSTSPQRPTPTRSISTPEKSRSVTDKEPPRHYEHSSPPVSILNHAQENPRPARSVPGGSILNGTAVANESPASPPSPTPSRTSPRWSPTATTKRPNGMSLASYSSFIEQFCWGGAPSSPPHLPRRSSSTSDLTASYFTESAPLGTSSGDHAGHSHSNATSTNHRLNADGDSPISTKSFSSLGSPPSYNMPGHHRSSSFTSPLTDARGHVTRITSSTAVADTDSMLFSGRELGVGRASMAC